MARVVVIFMCTMLLVVGANASCFIARSKCVPGQVPYKLPGVSTKCYDCTCMKSGTAVSCCLNIPIPTGFNSRKCFRVLDEDTCTYKVMKLRNPRRECPVKAWLG